MACFENDHYNEYTTLIQMFTSYNKFKVTDESMNKINYINKAKRKSLFAFLWVIKMRGVRELFFFN